MISAKTLAYHVVLFADYKTRLIILELLPLSMTLELNDVIFFLKSIRSPSSHFDILSFVSFSTSTTRSSSASKLKIPLTTTSLSSNFYFNRLPRIWNLLPTIDESLSTASAIHKVKIYFWSYFLTHFNPADLCSFHIYCPCPTCRHISHTNFTCLP